MDNLLPMLNIQFSQSTSLKDCQFVVERGKNVCYIFVSEYMHNLVIYIIEKTPNDYNYEQIVNVLFNIPHVKRMKEKEYHSSKSFTATMDDVERIIYLTNIKDPDCSNLKGEAKKIYDFLIGIEPDLSNRLFRHYCSLLNNSKNNTYIKTALNWSGSDELTEELYKLDCILIPWGHELQREFKPKEYLECINYLKDTNERM